MKTINCLFCFVLVLIIAGCQQTIDLEKEKEAIIELINKETEAYTDYDFKALAKAHKWDSLNIRLTAGTDGYVFLEGWDYVSKFLQNQIEGEEVPRDSNVSVEKSNYKIKVYPESAWVVCDEKWIYRYETDTVEINSIQVRFLEKINGEWKITFLSFVGTSGYDELEDSEEMSDLDEDFD